MGGVPWCIRRQAHLPIASCVCAAASIDCTRRTHMPQTLNYTVRWVHLNMDAPLLIPKRTAKQTTLLGALNLTESDIHSHLAYAWCQHGWLSAPRAYSACLAICRLNSWKESLHLGGFQLNTGSSRLQEGHQLFSVVYFRNPPPKKETVKGHYWET